MEMYHRLYICYTTSAIIWMSHSKCKYIIYSYNEMSTSNEAEMFVSSVFICQAEQKMRRKHVKMTDWLLNT